MRGVVSGYDGKGCNNGVCVPECRYYSEYGRIEDEEVIQRHREAEERHRKENTMVRSTGLRHSRSPFLHLVLYLGYAGISSDNVTRGNGCRWVGCGGAGRVFG